MRFCLKPTCRSLVDAGYCAEHSQQREQARPLFDVRKLYRTARWRKLRLIIKGRYPLCVDCLAKEPPRYTPTTDIDHEVPHRGNLELFWDERNLRGRCHECHSAKTARGE